MDQAAAAISSGQCQAAIVAATNLLLDPTTSFQFNKLSVLSPVGLCRAFDAQGMGYVRSEAAVVMVLMKRSTARRCYASIVNCSSNNDGYKSQGITYPSGDVQKELIQSVFKAIKLRPQQITYVEAHGTGTKAGDPQELGSVADIFCEGRKNGMLFVGSVKSNMGHAEASSALCSVVKVLAAMENEMLPANLHYEQPNPNIPSLHDGRIQVVDKNIPWSGDYAAINSFGIGGANVHLVLKRNQKSKDRISGQNIRLPRIIVVSARTRQATEHFINKILDKDIDNELCALLYKINATHIAGYNFRGYTIINRGTQGKIQIEEMDNIGKREVWWVFSGMGSQWCGMGKNLMSLRHFSDAIEVCANALAPHGVDLIHLISSPTEEAFSQIVNCFVAIAAIQIGLVDVMRAVGVEPDGIFGHSAGELGCAYADGTLTREQTILAAYLRGVAVQQTKLQLGAMASIGLSWEEAVKRCPSDIQAACHNSASNVTISGPPQSIQEFMEKMKKEGVFAKAVQSNNIAFHSKYIASAGPILRQNLNKLIGEGKPRSKRWLSSSVPESCWESKLAYHSSCDYHVNNLLSPVLFKQCMDKVPKNAILVEVSPHSLLLSLLRRENSSKNCQAVGLIDKNSEDTLQHFIDTLGRLYNMGINMDLSKLYSPVSFPVSRGTTMISPMVKWDHSAKWKVPRYPQDFIGTNDGSMSFEVDIKKESYLLGHVIDGRALYPATGYICLVWKAFAKKMGKPWEETAVKLYNIQFHYATVLPTEGTIKLLVNIFEGSGKFEVFNEAKTVVVTGNITAIAENSDEKMKIMNDKIMKSNEESNTFSNICLNKNEIYKELRLRGYHYNGFFRAVTQFNLNGTNGSVEWKNNWVSLLDSLLQFTIISENSRLLRIPTMIQSVIINPHLHYANIKNQDDLNVRYNKKTDIIQCGGVIIKNMTTSSINKKPIQNVDKPKLEKYVFVPYITSKIMDRTDVLTVMLGIIFENFSVNKFTVLEVLHKASDNQLLSFEVLDLIREEPTKSPQAIVVADSGRFVENEKSNLDKLNIQIDTRPLSEIINKTYHFVVGHNLLENKEVIHSLLNGMSEQCFVLTEENTENNASNSFSDLIIIAKYRTHEKSYLLLRKAKKQQAQEIKMLKVNRTDFKWLNQLQEEVSKGRKEGPHNKIVLCNWSPNGKLQAIDTHCGLLGLFKCLRLELMEEHQIRCVFVADKSSKLSEKVVNTHLNEKDLVVNVLKDNTWGSYRFLKLKNSRVFVEPEHAFANILNRGDLSTLSWIQNTPPPNVSGSNSKKVCNVYYSALNFRDVMLASGKLAISAIPGHKNKECFLGLEFSGKDSHNGNRVMGLLNGYGLATWVQPQELFLWKVPDHWSLSQAATVPMAYYTSYYSLVVRGGLRKGHSVLIHSGAGAVGQAAIRICLEMETTVFTTVGTKEKIDFIKQQFPQLDEKHIGNSRDTSFENMIMESTEGRGVDLVLNSLAEEKLEASLKCLAKNGKFLEIGKYDLARNTPLGMSLLLKNVSIEGILVDALFEEDESTLHDRQQTWQLMNQGIQSGVVTPLNNTIFEMNQLEQSFRYIASGKHIGKVLLKIREENDNNVLPSLLLKILPTTYFHPNKSCIVTGGMGGVGLELTRWLVERGACHIVLTSRTKYRTPYQMMTLDRIIKSSANNASPVEIKVYTENVTSSQTAVALLAFAHQMAPIGSIFNLSAVIVDRLLDNQTVEHFKKVTDAKVGVLDSMDKALRSNIQYTRDLDHFVAFSSVVSGRGNQGQSNYGMANSAIEHLCQDRRRDGLPAVCIQWGAIADVGLVASLLSSKSDQGKDTKKIEVAGTLPQSIETLFSTLDFFLCISNKNKSCTSGTDNNLEFENDTAVLSSIVVSPPRDQNSVSFGNVQDSKEEGMAVQQVANIIGLKSVESISGTLTLSELGMDSLMGSEIKEVLERNHSIHLSPIQIRQLTFNKLKSMTSSTATDDKNTHNQEIIDFSGESNHDGKFLMPTSVLVRMKEPMVNNNEKVFMVHSVEGFVDNLQTVVDHMASNFAIWGLQCTSQVPLDSMHALASHYVKEIMTIQNSGPYRLCGYSYGACIVFEMGLILEAKGQKVSCILLDGSPTFVANHLNHYRKTKNIDQDYDAFTMAYFCTLFTNSEFDKELKLIVGKEARLKMCCQLINKNNSGERKCQVSEEEVKESHRIFCEKLKVAYEYKPPKKFKGQLVLIKAQESYVEMAPDYNLKQMCSEEIKIIMVKGNHRSILNGESAFEIAKIIGNTFKKE